MKKIYIILIVLFSMCFPFLGTDSFSFLDVNFAGVSAGMGKAGSARRQTLEGIYINPASLAGIEQKFSLMASVNPYVDTLLLWSGALNLSFRKFSLAAGLYGLDSGLISGEDYETAYMQVFAFNFAGGLPIGNWLGWDRVSLDAGISMKIVSEWLLFSTARGVLFDAGVISEFKIKERWKTGAAFTAKNFGAAFYDGPADLYTPTYLVFGLSGSFLPSEKFNTRIFTDLEYHLDTRAKLNLGGEISLWQIFSYRIGYTISSVTEDGFTTGISLGIPPRDGKRTRLQLDYSVLGYGLLGSQHNIQIKAGW